MKKTLTVVGLFLVLSGCSSSPPAFKVVPESERIGDPAAPAVVILIDTSGSMADAVPDKTGNRRPKHQLAREALDRIVQRIGDWKKANSGKALYLGMYNFNGSAHEVLAMAEFEPGQAKAGVEKIPGPGGGTAIGSALHAAYESLSRTKADRRYILCVTDGENTSGPAPEAVARQIHQASGGKVEIHFIAFDVSASHFAFLKEVNGRVVEAGDAQQLEDHLKKVFDSRILAEEQGPIDF
jgi:hypothetical protein